MNITNNCATVGELLPNDRITITWIKPKLLCLSLGGDQSYLFLKKDFSEIKQL